MPKVIVIGSICLFGVIGFLSLFKGKQEVKKEAFASMPSNIEEIVLEVSSKEEKKVQEVIVFQEEKEPLVEDDFPDVDLIEKFFALDSSKLPIVETVTYTSRVPWLKGRPAWIADYASHYSTSRHFIARSLNRKNDYFTQKVAPGDRFNVLNNNIEFYLVIDLSRCKMLFFSYDLESDKRVLLKTYSVGVGRKDSKKASGYLSPLGKYTLGSKIAIYKEGTMGYFQDQKVEMLRIFGTRWIPFDQALENCTEDSRGFGLHGSPYKLNNEGSLIEDRSHVGKYDSDGCIRLNSEDIEELFSIIITKPTTVQLVHEFHDAKLPGIEKKDR